MFLLDVWFQPVVVAHSATNLVEVEVFEFVTAVTLKLANEVLTAPSTNRITPHVIGRSTFSRDSVKSISSIDIIFKLIL